LAVASGDPLSMDVSPDGQWLVALDSLLQAVTVYAINSSTGVLTLKETLTYITPTAGAIDPSQVRFAPSGKWVAVALGTAGDLAIPFTTSTGVLATSYNVIAPPSTTGDFAVAMDGNDFLYVARTGLVASYSLDSQTPTVLVASAAAGSGPRAVALSSGYNYVYLANQSDGTISGYGIGTSGTLTKLAGSPFTAPVTVGALGRDRSGSYLLAAGYGTTGVQLFTIGTGGALTLTASAATGKVTTVPVAMALTH
jgi:6-phosphogluconolactonase (cycloisomerase 2 family)